LRPDLAVIDVRMPGGGRSAIAAIREHSPETVVLVCSSLDDRYTRTAMTDAGAAAYVVKGDDDVLDVARGVMGLS
jgi:DNA-binding NarL/FixJ family response regulator